MINEKYARQYCAEDISNIENYKQAVMDYMKAWDIHHRAEILPCGLFSMDDLKKFGLYYNRPASELIFLTHAEHIRLHRVYQNLNKVSVEKYSMDGTFIATYSSIREAARQTGARQYSIVNCCRGRCKSAGGYVWKYA
jgi:hypothetical protein